MKVLTIGKVAEETGVGVETVRFYERQGLLEEPPRKASGYRQFPEEAVARLRFIKRAKELGFSLGEIKDLFSLGVDPSSTCGDIKQRAEVKLEDIQAKIRDLQRMKRALTKLVSECRGSGPTSECPILESLRGRERK